MLRRLRKYFALAPAEQALLRESLLLLPSVSVMLRVRGMARTQALLERVARRRPRTLAPREIARLVEAAAGFVGARCLARSLVLCHLLRARGAPAEIRIGVYRHAEGGLAAHAWVELDALPLNDRPDVRERYAVLPRVGARSRRAHC